MRNFLTDITKKIFSFFHLEVMKKDSIYTSPILIDLRNAKSSITTLDVIAFYSKHQDIKYILNIPKDKIILREIMKVWIEILRIKKVEDPGLKMEDRPSFLFFKDFFSNYQPKTVVERFEIESGPINEKQREYFSKPPLYATPPWVKNTPEYEYEMYLNFMKMEFEEHFGKKYALEDGWKGFGPASNRLIEMEYIRILNIYESIQKHGYLEKFGLPFIEVYIKDNEYRVSLEGAWHRTAILFAINEETLPAIIRPNTNVIKRSEAKNWPLVLSKHYTEEQAVEIFDNTFNSALK